MLPFMLTMYDNQEAQTYAILIVSFTILKD